MIDTVHVNRLEPSCYVLSECNHGDGLYIPYLFLNDSSGCLARQNLYMAMTQTPRLSWQELEGDIGAEPS